MGADFIKKACKGSGSENYSIQDSIEYVKGILLVKNYSIQAISVLGLFLLSSVAQALQQQSLSSDTPENPAQVAVAEDKPNILPVSALNDFPWPAADHVISYGTDPLQFGELRLPKGDGPHPVMMLIHGSCWLADYDIAHIRKLAHAFTQEGFATWTVEYRRVGNEGGGWPGTYDDIAGAGDYLVTLAKSHPLDLTRTITAGHSAGGHLALWYANRPERFKKAETVTPVGVLALAPAADLAYLHEKKVCGHVIDKLMGGSPAEHPDRYKQGSGIDRLPVMTAQHIILGKYDTSWTPVGRRYVKQAKAMNAPIEVHEALESGHFDMIDPDSTTWPMVLAAAKSLIKK